MQHYCVSVGAVRDKVCLIKLIRAINKWGLKDSKDWCEKNFDFDKWQDDWINFNIKIDAEQLGHLAHHAFISNNNGRVVINSSEKIAQLVDDPFDFTREIYPAAF